MELRERRHDPVERGIGGGAGFDAGDDNLGAVREAGDRFLEAADRAIDRALSGDSEAFLRASRQEGGE